MVADLCMKGPVGDTTQHGAILRHNGAAAMAPVHDQASNVLLGHIWQLLADGVLQTDQPAWQHAWTMSACNMPRSLRLTSLGATFILHVA